MNRSIIKAVFGDKYLEEIDNGICPICHKKVNINSFKNALSKKEFAISGMCQSCQDKIFKEN